MYVNVYDAYAHGADHIETKPLGTTLENLRTVLQALDRTGDFTNPQIVNLRRLIAERINTLEALKAAGEADYLGSSN